MDIYKFVDESCHLENDQCNVMALGYIRVPEESFKECKELIKEIKERHNKYSEIKWSKVSNAKSELYSELIDYFFDSPLCFRAILIKDKHNLDHDQFNQGSHDNFYYKMTYYLLYNEYIDSKDDNYKVYLDYKDTRGREKLNKIKEIFDNKFDNNSPFIRFQHIRSHESVFIQLADLFIGAITYKSRGLLHEPNANQTKISIINQLEEQSGYNINEGTVPWEEKFNIFDHQIKKRG